MTKIFFLIGFIILFWTGGNNLLTADDRTVLLAGSSSKSWYLHSKTPGKPGATCQSTHAISLDNTYTFFADGTFEFDHGMVTEDEACENNCCGDMVNLTGTWKFTKSGKGLRIIADREKGSSSSIEAVMLYDASIDRLEDGILTISQTHPRTNTLYTIEFRKR